MTDRTNLAHRLEAVVGSALRIDDAGSGWPSLATLFLDETELPIALFVSRIGRSHRGRDLVERRFQNPAGDVPLVGVPGRESVLVGVLEGDDSIDLPRPLLAIADANRRDDGRTTRWSVFLRVESLVEASAIGWATDISDSGETIYYVDPALLPVAVSALVSEAVPDSKSIYGAVATLNLRTSFEMESARDEEIRVRRTVTSLVRDSRFSGEVLAAYDRECAMCGLGLGLVQGAHIYPASAPGSRDIVSNGMALCANHHLAFDRHLIAVHPGNLEIGFHPSVLERSVHEEAVANFVSTTFDVARSHIPGRSPDPLAFEKRYAHYPEMYEWLDKIWA
jgi:hypothetical protein